MNLITLYKEYNFPGKDKLYKIAHKEGLSVTHKEVDTFLSQQKVSQIFSRKQRKPGHIVAFQPDTRYEMDLIDMTKYATRNKGYGWIFLIIDIFSRKVYAYLMKNKTEDNITQVLNEFFTKHHPELIISDNESGFKSKKTQDIMEEKEVIHDMVDIGDHKALGVIDRAVQTIKNSIYKHFKDSNTTAYMDKLKDIIKAYNYTPHSAIADIAPEDATNKSNMEQIQIINNQKSLANSKSKRVINVGDTIRIREAKSKFSRSFDVKYSKEQYQVEQIDGRRALLDSGDWVSTRNIMRVPRIEQEDYEPDEVEEVKKEARTKRLLQQAGVVQTDIIEGKRKRKPNSKYIDK